MPSAPRSVLVSLPQGDSRLLRFPSPRDTYDGSLVDPGSYEEIRIGFAPATDFEPTMATGEPVLTKTLGGGGVAIENGEIVVQLSPADTSALNVGRYVIHLRFERGIGTAHSVAPFHVLEITTPGL